MFNDFERLANRSQDAIYHYDIQSRRFLFYNTRFKELFTGDDGSDGYIPSRKVFEAIHPEDRNPAINAFRNSIKNGSDKGEAEYRLIRRDGSIRWLHDRWIVLKDAEGRAVSIEGFIRDDTERRISEIQFIKSKENSIIGSYIVQDGQFKYVNAIFAKIIGYSEEELIGVDSLSIVQEDYRDHVRESAVAMLKGEKRNPYEFCVIDRSGAANWIMETVTPIVFEGKRATLGYFMDITKLRQIQGNLSTLGMMVGTISHSLRGCLTGVNAGLYLIETGFYRDKPAQIEEGLDVTKLMADRIRKLVMDILYYCKERDLEIETVDVWQFFREVAVTLENRVRAANIEFVTECPHDSGTFEIDQEAVRPGLVNIIENAMEACIEDPRPVKHRICFIAQSDDQNIYFQISDNGPGMDKEQAGKVFQLFYSSKGKKGTGLGLFVTRKAVLKHQGRITVDSEPGRGTTFFISLPRKFSQGFPDSKIHKIADLAYT